MRQVSGENLKIEVDGKMWWRHYSVVIGEEKTSNLGAPALKVAPSKDMYASPSFKDVTVKPMPWKRVSSLAVSSSGTSGVVFVRFGEKDGVAVRGVRVVFQLRLEEYGSYRSLILQEKITRKNQRSNTSSIMSKTLTPTGTEM